MTVLTPLGAGLGTLARKAAIVAAEGN